jgi:hypothetical protein
MATVRTPEREKGSMAHVVHQAQATVQHTHQALAVLQMLQQ